MRLRPLGNAFLALLLQPLLGINSHADYIPDKPENSKPSPWIKVSFRDEFKVLREYWCHQSVCGPFPRNSWDLDAFRNTLVPLYALKPEEHEYEKTAQASYYKATRSAYSLHYDDNTVWAHVGRKEGARIPLYGHGAIHPKRDRPALRNSASSMPNVIVGPVSGSEEIPASILANYTRPDSSQYAPTRAFYNERYRPTGVTRTDKPKVILNRFYFPLELLVGSKVNLPGKFPDLDFLGLWGGHDDANYQAVAKAFQNGYRQEAEAPANTFVGPHREAIQQALNALAQNPGDRRASPRRLLPWEAELLVKVMAVLDYEAEEGAATEPLIEDRFYAVLLTDMRDGRQEASVEHWRAFIDQKILGAYLKASRKDGRPVTGMVAYKESLETLRAEAMLAVQGRLSLEPPFDPKKAAERVERTEDEVKGQRERTKKK